MNSRTEAVMAGAALVIGAALWLGGRALPAQQVTAITGVTVIDGTDRDPIRQGVVLIRGERIEAVGPASAVAIPAGARVQRHDGRYLLPGFIDMHAHVAFGPVLPDSASPGGTGYLLRYDGRASRELARTLLGFGITTVRNPGGPTGESVGLRDLIRLGRIPGPRVVTAGAVIDRSSWPGLTAPVRTEADVRAEVARQAAAGVDYVKLYATLPLELVRAGIDEAHRRRVQAIGHLFATSWTDAANAGIDGIVHVVPGSPALLPASRRAEFMKRFRGTQFMLEWFDYVDFESAEFTGMVKALLDRHVTVDPTLVVFEAMAWGDDPQITSNPDLAFAPRSLLDNWRVFQLSKGWKPEDFEAARRAWPNVLAFVNRLHEAGVHLTVGTDVPNPWVPPGASFHRELGLLVAAGIPPAAVLRMATRNGAEALGLATDLGTVTAGKRADLVVLDANPLERIENTRRIAWVVQGGRWLRPADLLPRRSPPPRSTR